MFYCEEKTPRHKASRSRLIRALDTTVAFATLETYGVIDDRDSKPRGAAGTEPGAGRGTRFSGAHGTGCGQARRPQGRPGAATAAGRRRHRAARKRIERLGQ